MKLVLETSTMEARKRDNMTRNDLMIRIKYTQIGQDGFRGTPGKKAKTPKTGP
jgi:hypothetical protein